MKKKYLLEDIKFLQIDINTPSIIFLKWDLGAGKTTISKHIISNILWIKWNITSPTYTYFNKYKKSDNTNVYHFDLYRINNYDEFFAIWAEEIFDNNSWIIIVEWPDIIEKYYKPDIIISLNTTKNIEERIIDITYEK